MRRWRGGCGRGCDLNEYTRQDRSYAPRGNASRDALRHSWLPPGGELEHLILRARHYHTRLGNSALRTGCALSGSGFVRPLGSLKS